MELWIRSQDRENIVKINRQYGLHWEDKTMIIADYQPDFVGTEGEYYELLGKYSTKERALEVLDEIQRILQPKIIINNTSDDSLPIIDGEWVKSIKAEMNYDTKELSTYVYEMPKE